ncbi:hypothetical protein [Winogradskyella sp. Asnod2-B02-A]|uniref:hypothetical protein n=1 Tax=Winogradskyella sp. Asnod2-B02-A TaxID=3160583 RepID=UPI00386D0A32
MDIYSVVNSELNTETINDKVAKTVTKRYLGMENSEFIKEEIHIEYNNGLVTNMVFYNTIPSFERDTKYTTEKIGEIKCNYDGKKLIKRVDAFKDSDDETSVRTLNYSYLSDKSVIYKGYVENTLEINGKITLINDTQSKEVYETQDEDVNVITYYKEFNKKLRVSTFKTEYFDNKKLKTESYSYAYKDDNLYLIKDLNYEMRYEYIYDNNGNWIKRFGYENGEVVELLVRKIINK